MNEDEDLYFSNGGGVAEALSRQARISRVMTEYIWTLEKFNSNLYQKNSYVKLQYHDGHITPTSDSTGYECKETLNVLQAQAKNLGGQSMKRFDTL